MRYLLTSSPCLEDGTLNPANGFTSILRLELNGVRRTLFICSDPERHEKTVFFSNEMRQCFADSGFNFAAWEVLDGENASEARALIDQAEFIVLAGGHVPTQNRFFQAIQLKSLLVGWRGLVMGISAGTMNSARIVYAQPELPGEAIAPDYIRFLPGLGLTETMVLPHYQMNKNDVLDGLRVYEDIALPDSAGRCFYALPDGSFLHGTPNAETLRGEAWRIKDGGMERITAVGETMRLR